MLSQRTAVALCLPLLALRVALSEENAHVNIANCAKLTTSPAIEAPKLKQLVDGDRERGVAFPVGSKGPGSFTFTFPRERTVAGVRLPPMVEIYYMTRYRVEADADGDGEFEKTLAEGTATPGKPSSCDWQPTHVRALRIVAVEGEAKGKRAFPAIGEIELLGVPLPTDVKDARASGNPVLAIRFARPVDRWIDLSGRTRPVVVAPPPAHGDAARQIAAAVASRGGQRPKLVDDPAQATPEDANVIALGNVNDNELIARLYFSRYAYEDSLLPGKGAFTIRTVHDPYPWHGKGDIIVVGTSDPTGAAAGVEAFAERLAKRDGRVGMDYCLHVSSAKPLTQAERAALAKENTPHYVTFLRSAESYLKTGIDDYAKHAIAILDRIDQEDAKTGKHLLDWSEETNSWKIMATWDAFDECPLMSEDQRRRFTSAFLRLLRSLPPRVSGYAGLGRDDLVSWNHTTFPLLGLYFGSRYFVDYYGLSECETPLAKAHACFRAQAKSWKPQEDADSYLTLTSEHAYRYCLAEWDLDFFESGRMRQYADYIIGICDNVGRPSGFGDSGIGLNPTLIEKVLPLAFWYYRAPGYLWTLQRVSGGQWANPFHRDVEPRRDDRHTGVRAFPLDEQLYEYTRRHSYYNEPTSPPNVPLADAFDKIVFRESWDADSQYLILDGFSRGKHLHYDANAIPEYVDGGHRRLIDHDYLTRNTTEHNMVTILRDGRADTLVPSCAGLRCAMDAGGEIGMVATELLDYLGMDCRRYLFWKKGDYFVVMDRLTARESGEFGADIVWKMQDRGGEEIAEPGSFVAPRVGQSFLSRNVPVIDDPEASGGKAVAFTESDSTLSFVVDLPAGECALTLHAYGVDGSSDSLFVSVDAKDKTGYHVPQTTYGRSSGKHDLSVPTPTVTAQEAGKHLVTITLRERPPIRLDKLSLQPPGDVPAIELEAEAVQRATEADAPPLDQDRFVIKWADPVATSISRTKPKGIVVPVCKLWQRLHRRMDAGETIEAANLLYTDEGGGRASISRVAPGAVLVHGEEPTLLAVRGASVPGLRLDAEMLYVSPTRVAWAKGKSFELDGMRLTTSEVTDVEVDLGTGKTLPVNVAIEGVAQLSTGKLRAFLTGLPRETNARTVSGGDQTPATALWRDEVTGPVRRLKVADVNGDGAPEILVASGPQACAFSQDGTQLWSYALNGACHDVSVGELDASPGAEVVAAGGDAHLHLLSAEGKLLRKTEIRGPQWNANFGDRPWAAYTVSVADLAGDGTNEIIAGTQSYELRVYDSALNELKRTRNAVQHGSIDFHVVDADGDGKQEIFATDHYGFLRAFDHAGEKLLSLYTSIGDTQAVVSDLDGDATPELVYGSSTGDLHCTRLPKTKPWGRNVERLWNFDNFGYAVRRLRAADLDGDGSSEVILASQTGYVYVLDGQGNEKWRHRVGSDVVEVLVLDCPRWKLACLDRSGALVLLNADGTADRTQHVGFEPSVGQVIGDLLVVGGGNSLAAFWID